VPAGRSRGRTELRPLTPLVRGLLAVQAAALVAGAIAIVVLSATSDSQLAAGYIVTDVVVTILLAALLVLGPNRRRARTPILLVELIAVLVSLQVWSSGRPWIALAVGVPAAVALLLLLAAYRPDHIEE